MLRILSVAMIVFVSGCQVDGKESDPETSTRVVGKSDAPQSSSPKSSSDAKAALTEYVLPVGIAPDAQKIEIRQVGDSDETSKLVWLCEKGEREDKPKFICRPGQSN